MIDTLIIINFVDWEFMLDAKANLMTYNTFTFKTEAQMLLFRRIWEDNGTALFDKYSIRLNPINKGFIL